LITRTIVPVVSQPVADPENNRVTGIGDTTFTAFLSNTDSADWTWGVGPVVLLPTASDDVLGNDEWGLGPSFVILTTPGPWVVGSLFSQLWSVGHDGGDEFTESSKISLFTWQYFINYNFPSGIYFTTAPIITANWESDSSERWTVPIGGGFGKLFMFGKQPVNTSIQAYYNIEKPDFGPDWTLRLQAQLLFPK
jgi:hypothetical protein